MIDTIIVMGMHRSGTSCLTGCLKSYGLNLGEVSDYNKHNRKGNQENRKIFRLNEALFNYNSGSWNIPPKRVKWNNELMEIQNQVLSEYQQLEKPIGIKDPRMLFAYPFWEKKLDKHSLVGTFRHPKAVALSLAARKNKKLHLSIQQGYDLWKLYNEKLIKLYQRNKFPIVNFDLPIEEYLIKIKTIAKSLSLYSEFQNSFFDDSLKNQKTYSIEECPENLLPIYRQLLEIDICLC